MGDPVGAGVDLGVALRLAIEYQGHGIGPFSRVGFEAAEGKRQRVKFDFTGSANRPDRSGRTGQPI